MGGAATADRIDYDDVGDVLYIMPTYNDVSDFSQMRFGPALEASPYLSKLVGMQEGGAALMAVGRAGGENRAIEAAQQAISSRLLDITIDGARGILFNITGGEDLTLFEVNEAASIIRETAHPDVNLIFGAVIDEAMNDEVRITVIATGFDGEDGQDHAARLQLQQRRMDAQDLFSASVVDRDNIEIPAFLRRRG